MAASRGGEYTHPGAVRQPAEPPAAGGLQWSLAAGRMLQPYAAARQRHSQWHPLNTHRNAPEQTMTAIRIPPSWHLPEKLATPESIYVNRRQLLRTLGLGSIGLSLAPVLGCATAAPSTIPTGKSAPALGRRFAGLFPAERNAAYSLGDRQLTPEDISASYNNFYEFTTNKGGVWKLAQQYHLPSWQIEVAGLVKKPRTLDLDELFNLAPLEERLYRFRCVERWAMQVPWTGYPLRKLIDALEPLSSARFVRFFTILDRDNLPGQRESPWYPWPYAEALRMDEARNELAFVGVGLYGHALPMQHGAPWRVVAPWKYGYKNPKSIVRIEFVAEQPATFWNELQADEYGFYSNVDPGHPHPRWSQAQEQDIGTQEMRPTLLYNGYGEQVAGMYDGTEV